MALLNPGDRFPALPVDVAGDGQLFLPEALAGSYGVVLFYRGGWCPYCRSQLRGFERERSRLDEVGARVIALSVDDEPTTRATIDRLRLTFPVGYGADPDVLAELTGVFVNPEPRYVQTTGFLLDPAGNVVESVYGSGALGGIPPDDVVSRTRYLRTQADEAAARAS